MPLWYLFLVSGTKEWQGAVWIPWEGRDPVCFGASRPAVYLIPDGRMALSGLLSFAIEQEELAVQ